VTRFAEGRPGSRGGGRGERAEMPLDQRLRRAHLEPPDEHEPRRVGRVVLGEEPARAAQRQPPDAVRAGETGVIRVVCRVQLCERRLHQRVGGLIPEARLVLAQQHLLLGQPLLVGQRVQADTQPTRLDPERALDLRRRNQRVVIRRVERRGGVQVGRADLLVEIHG